ncbi:MAG: serine hydrolase, partial [Planctomycetes bacterium]|nr:serine hydrolase [Planctomycetota bacterium]
MNGRLKRIRMKLSTFPSPKVHDMRAVIVSLVLGVGILMIPGPAHGAKLGVKGAQFTIDGNTTFLLGFSYYGALGASENTLRLDLDDAQRHGFNWLRVWVTWESFGHDVSAVDAAGKIRPPFMDRLKWLVAECDRRGMILDLTLTRGTDLEGAPTAGRLADLNSHRQAVKSLAMELKPWANWFLDLANEHDVRDSRHVSVQDTAALRTLVRELDPDRLVTASFGGHDLNEQDLRNTLLTEKVDFVTPHRPRQAGTPGQTETATRRTLELMRQIGHVVPVLYQEPFRRGYTTWEPTADDFITDLRGAVAGGAAGWCFHNGAQRAAPDGQPRRSFDVSNRRLFDQFDAVERQVLERIKQVRTSVNSSAYPRQRPPEEQNRKASVLSQGPTPGHDLPERDGPPTVAEDAAAHRIQAHSSTSRFEENVPPAERSTDDGPAAMRVSIHEGRWQIDGQFTNPGSIAAGLLMNVRMVNAVFEDANDPEFDAEANTDRFLAAIPDYTSQGVNAFTIGLQGGFPGYEGARNSAFDSDGSLRTPYLRRVEKVIRACDRAGAVVILGCFYQRQDQVLRDNDAVRNGVKNVAEWIRNSKFGNVVLEITNEFGHGGFNQEVLKSATGQAELMQLARQVHPRLLVSTSSLGDAKYANAAAQAADFLLVHLNSTKLENYERRIEALKKFGKPIVCNEDDKQGTDGAQAAKICVEHGLSWGLMAERVNQHRPFRFLGAKDDPPVYAEIQRLTAPAASTDYFPPPESQGGWRKLTAPDDIRRLAGMDPEKLDLLKRWLLQSDNRNFAAVVIRRGYVVLEVERGNSAQTDVRRVASVSKAICATVLAIASEQSQHGQTPRKMSFDDAAFDFIPWAHPLSDPRKRQITVKQLLNHTSGICPEAVGAPNDGTWEYILGRNGDPRTSQLAFDPGQGCGYSTHALCHAALVCENVTGKPYDEFAIAALFQPIGCEHWWFQSYDGAPEIGRHPSHGMGMPARDLARIGYCLLQDGRWGDRQVVPKWFVNQTAHPTQEVKTP